MDEIADIMRRLDHKILASFEDGETLIPADEARIKCFEEEIGYRLPVTYRQFLTKYGGAYLRNGIAELAVRLPRHEDLSVSFFFAFYGGVSPGRNTNDLSYNYRLIKDQLPSGMIPIAQTGGDDVYCLSCANEARDSVYVYLPEGFEDEKPGDRLFQVARSFLEFLRSLRTMSDEEANERYK
jgi:hypothetical protein